MSRSLLVLVALLLIAALGACSSPTPAPTTPPATGPTGAPLAVLTAGNLADLGKDVFSSNCARCHGDKGQGAAGPTLIGGGNALSKYGDAQGLFSFISKNMPKSSPGSLSTDQYLRVLAFVLVQNNLVKADAPLDSTKLAAIAVK